MRNNYTSGTTILRILLIVLIIVSCRKTEQVGIATDKTSTASSSLQVRANSTSLVKKISDALTRQDKKYKFLRRFEKQEGLPIWDKLSVYISSAGINNRGSSSPDTVVLVPIVLENTRIVSSFLVCKVQGDIVLIKLIRGRQYKLFGFDKHSDSMTANAVASQLMYMQSQVFGDTTFLIKDSRLFNYEKSPGVLIKPKYVTIKLQSPQSPKYKMASITYMQCYTYVHEGNQGQLVGVAPGGTVDNSYSETVCYPVTIWFDDGEYDTGGGGTYDGGTTSGDGGGGTYTDPYSDPCDRTLSGRVNPDDDPCGGSLGWEPVPLDDDAGGTSYDPNSAFNNIQTPIDTEDEPLISNGIDVQDIASSSPDGGTPRLIGKTQNRGNTEDLQYGTAGNSSDISPSEITKTNDQLFQGMENLFYWCTFFDNDLKDVGNKMINKFKTNTSTNNYFEDPVLNQRVSYSSNMINFLKEFGNELRNQLSSNGGNIDDISTIDMGTVRPKFNSLYNKFHGLQILINDTEYTEIELDNFSIDPITKKWEAEVTVTIYDHFGLDKHDALTYQNNHSGFADWWLLQQTRGFVPFQTKVIVHKRILGAL
jgi:hypothetical protein